MTRSSYSASAALRRPALLGLVGAVALVGALAPSGRLSLPEVAPLASALPNASEATTPQTDASAPASQVTMIGATPEEPGAPGRYETWGLGSVGSGGTKALVRYYTHPGPRGEEEGTWTLGPPLPAGFKPEGAAPLFGEMTATGIGVLAGEIGGNPVLLTRDPGGAFEEAKAVQQASEGGKEKEKGSSEEGEEEPVLGSGEALFGLLRVPLIAPLEEANGKAGALVVPVNTGGGAAVEGQVLHWDGQRWQREPIEVPSESHENLRVLALGASSSNNAWLLAQLASAPGYPSGAVALFRRTQKEAGWVWKPVKVANGAGAEKIALTIPVLGEAVEPFTVKAPGAPPAVKNQILTVTGEGVWIDGERTDIHTGEAAPVTMYFKPATEGGPAGNVISSWCQLPLGTPAGTPQCTHPLPEALPTGYSRSIAWANGAPYGERVITGLPEGVSLRLEGESFTRVLALGAGHEPVENPGAQLGAAFSEPTEGWLGESGPPVHITRKPAPSELTPWPTPFRHPLLALAPQPGAPVGALSSEALAVGEDGAVARYKPGAGWLPESLFGAGEQVERDVQLRAVAWPSSKRAYAVGDHGQMWLWRAETGLWEKDPATPLNFRGNLVGIAFDPNDPARGYAVGSSEVGLGGVLLRYGKTWTEEALPPEAQGAVLTSIAFAGSEAIVAFSKQVNPNENRFVGGLLVNNGSGWRVEGEAAAVAGTGVPRTVAGLADGGAAFTAAGGPEGARVYERQQAGAPWQATPTPLPGEAGQLALFREGGSLRAIVTGGGVANIAVASPPPPGSPPDLYPPLGEQSPGVTNSPVLRQTAEGWSDESHELDPVEQPAGGYASQDLPYRPDSIFAMLVDPGGAAGWAVGGDQGSREGLQTGDIERYPAGGSAPVGEGEVSVPLQTPGEQEAKEPAPATFAIGGHAECVAPCAARERAGVGPQVWLSAALALARKADARAFLYTGPSVTEGKVEGARVHPLPFAREFERTASILAPDPSFAPALVAAAPQDLDARSEGGGTEALFAGALSAELGEPVPGACVAEVNCHYYTMESTGTEGSVRVIVLDESSEVSQTQIGWLATELANAKSAGEPAIVVGSADLNAEIAANLAVAKTIAGTLEAGEASAYFYDSPEKNVHESLRWGGERVPTFGTGTLGYEQIYNQERSDFHGAGGILLAQLHLSARVAGSNRVPVSVRLIPVIGELALEAKDGILLRRSEPALFEGLARRPRAGSHANINSDEALEDPYVRIPSNCVGQECAVGLFPEYTFSSSNPEVGQFVEPNLAAAENLHAVRLGSNGKPIPDAESGLFCAYNPGTTTVTISAGGLSSSQPVTVQPGSVRQPCGTVPIKPRSAASAGTTVPVPPPSPAPAPNGSPPAGVAPVVPVPPPPPLVAARTPQAPPRPAPFFLPPVPTTPLLAFVPPPVPTPARPTPPSGTSAVTSPVEMAEHEEEQEEATESVSNQALAYSAPEHEPVPTYLLGIVLLAALAGASVGRRRRRDRRQLCVAPATLSSMRTQRNLTRRSRGGR